MDDYTQTFFIVLTPIVFLLIWFIYHVFVINDKMSDEKYDRKEKDIELLLLLHEQRLYLNEARQRVGLAPLEKDVYRNLYYENKNTVEFVFNKQRYREELEGLAYRSDDV